MTSDVKLDRLQRNDPRMTELDLWLNGDSDLDKLTQSLQENRTVCSVSILYTCRTELLEEAVRRRDGTIASTNYQKSLVSLLGSLPPTLRKICITGPTCRSNSFPIKALVSFLKSAIHCKRLCLGRLVVTATDTDFDELAWCIQKSCLEEVYLNGSVLMGGLLRVPRSQEKLMHALSTLSTLKALTLNGTGLSHQYHNAASGFSLQSLACLCQSKTLSKLLLYDFDLSDDHLEHLSAHFNNGDTQLREIRLSSCFLGSRGLAALSQMLQAHSSRLEGLHLWIKDLAWDKESTNSWLALAASLRSAHLRDFRLLTSVRQQMLAQEAPPFSTGAVQAAFCQSLHDNYDLHEFSMLCGQDRHAEIAYYLRLNKLGRKKLFRIHWQKGGNHQSSFASKQEWVDVLIASRHDLNCFFYFLSMNPALCH